MQGWEVATLLLLVMVPLAWALGVMHGKEEERQINYRRRQEQQAREELARADHERRLRAQQRLANAAPVGVVGQWSREGAEMVIRAREN